MSITTIAKRLTTLRTATLAAREREDAGHRRLIAACFPTPDKDLQFANGEIIPPIHPYSCFWNMVDDDPRRWN